MGLLDIIELDIDTPASLPNIGIYKLGLHIIQIFFAFLTFCIILPVISIEGHYSGSSQPAPNYTLVVTLVSIFVSTALALFPLAKYRNHLVPVRNFFLRPRTAVIFTCFLTLAWFAAMISMTVHSNDDAFCKLNQKWIKSDANYPSAWMKQCNSAKAAAAFCWFSFFVWLASAICSIILLWHEKKVKHAEADAAAAAARSADFTGKNGDEDAQTIVDMDFSDKKDNELSDRDDTRSPTLDNEPTQLTETLTPPNQFQSPYIPNNDYVQVDHHHPSYEAPRAIPAYVPPPSNLTSPYNPHANNISSVGSPYSLPASVASPYPTPHNTAFQPYSQASHVSYSNIPLDQSQQYNTAAVGPYPYAQQNYPSAPTYQEYPAYH